MVHDFIDYVQSWVLQGLSFAEALLLLILGSMMPVYIQEAVFGARDKLWPLLSDPL